MTLIFIGALTAGGIPVQLLFIIISGKTLFLLSFLIFDAYLLTAVSGNIASGKRKLNNGNKTKVKPDAQVSKPLQQPPM